MPEWSVPGYTALKALGSGGFGDVVLARHDTSGTLVAIKYLRPGLLADPEFAGMFRREATVLASLDDPNVVRLYEYVESPLGAAIVMELIGGVSLREILTFQGKTTAEAALAVLQGSLLGLAAAHRRGVVHRDYKPANVLVNGDGISKLTDFGIAARSGDRSIPAGTVPYAAPEQMAGAPATPASDVYAATATFYECLTGRLPFGGETADLSLQHRTEPVPLDSIPEPLRALVAAGMATDPGRRPADATTFVAELNTAAAGAYSRHWADRGRSHLGEAALLLAALWPSGAPPTVQGTTVHRIPLRRRMKSRHISAANAALAASAVIAVAAAGILLGARVTHRPSAPSHPVAVVQSVPLQLSSALSGAFNNVGISDDASPAAGNLDGGGYSYSAQALAAAGLTPGAAVTFAGMTFTWPDVAAGAPDNVLASGQTIAVSGSGTLGFLGASDYYSSSGTGTITYSDGTTQSFAFSLADWWANAAEPGGHIIATVPYMNTSTGQMQQQVSVYVATVPLQPGKTVQSVTLPDVSQQPVRDSPAMHIFAVATSRPVTPSLPAPPPTQVNMQGITVAIGAVNTDPDATDVATTMAAYFGGIDARNYQQAWETYTPALQASVPFQPWSSALSTTQDSQVTVESIRHDGNGNLEAGVSFQSHQAGQYGPNPGETCTNWTLDYYLVPAAGASAGPVSLSYQINKVADIGAGHSSC